MSDVNRGVIRSAEILAVGTEILMGQIVNTNAAYIARELRDLGISSHYQTVVGDNEGRIIEAIKVALERSDLLLITGGLGPTEDDISMESVAKALGLELELHEESWARIQAYFTLTGREVLESNKKQALMPVGQTVLPNDNGTAPGVFVETEYKGKIGYVVLLPGPPSENTLMFKSYLQGILKQKSYMSIQSRFIRLIGIGESMAEEKIRDLVHEQSDPTIAPYASEGEVVIRVTTASSRDEAALAAAELRLEDSISAIRERLGDYIYHIGEESLYEVVYMKMKEKGLTLGIAESCTAGLLSSRFGDIPGVSAVYRGTVVAYDNQVKMDLLGVQASTLEAKGAVSAEVAEEMARGARQALSSDYAIAITGTAGPDGGTAEKPVGTVYIAVAGPEGVSTTHYRISGNRARVRSNASLWACDLLRRRIDQIES